MFSFSTSNIKLSCKNIHIFDLYATELWLMQNRLESASGFTQQKLKEAS